MISSSLLAVRPEDVRADFLWRHLEERCDGVDALNRHPRPLIDSSAFDAAGFGDPRWQTALAANFSNGLVFVRHGNAYHFPNASNGTLLYIMG
jgi:hypothetical protein